MPTAAKWQKRPSQSLGPIHTIKLFCHNWCDTKWVCTYHQNSIIYGAVSLSKKLLQCCPWPFSATATIDATVHHDEVRLSNETRLKALSLLFQTSAAEQDKMCSILFRPDFHTSCCYQRCRSVKAQIPLDVSENLHTLLHKKGILTVFCCKLRPDFHRWRNR